MERGQRYDSQAFVLCCENEAVRGCKEASWLTTEDREASFLESVLVVRCGGVIERVE